MTLTRPFLIAALAALPLAATLSAPAHANRIEQACLQSGRTAANRSLCGCIQRVADQTLTRSDQRTAARFFTDPDMAQETRMSKSDRDNAFWDRYKTFGFTATRVCR